MGLEGVTILSIHLRSGRGRCSGHIETLVCLCVHLPRTHRHTHLQSNGDEHVCRQPLPLCDYGWDEEDRTLAEWHKLIEESGW